MTDQSEEARWQFVRKELQRIDGTSPTKFKASEKHKKMARSPFQFLRGSAQLFYADIAANLITIPSAFYDAPLTRIMGDCHFSNFGFFTEEGSHSDTVIWAPNDFDDACEGPAVFDILRFLTSLHLLGDYLEGLKAGRYSTEEIEDPEDKPVPSAKAINKACAKFLTAWADTAKEIAVNLDLRDQEIEKFGKKHFLHPHMAKTHQRTAVGKKFMTKSTVGKLAHIVGKGVRFKSPHEKLAPIDARRRAAVIAAMRPYMDDEILDVALRLGAGTGSVNVDRFYLLVGPKGPVTEAELPLAHVVEVKQQREAAMIHHFPDMSPINTLMPAHLTVECQRRMNRRPDLILDDLEWDGHHWLVRSRHHARYGVDPEDIMEADNPDKAFVQYAEACAQSLAIAHSRGDRRSTLFETAMVDAIKTHGDELLATAETYAQQAVTDHGLLTQAIG
ncbi:DUF2252 family protein [Terasakiella sp. A23]|uniref:DUF2252 family protein n=1 Tax=Terasakiella sp. FCG-A23 TaxID=3080561 RepID=UPI002953AC73|nr:DUF2252 family protein [Terasakiella sp. A23]MDV7341104.1 DUF2252 family protein [Terasakiella sp. A23]